MHAAPLLLTWSDRAPERRPGHHGARPAADRGPVLRLLAESPVRYGTLWLLATADNLRSTEVLAEEARAFVPDVHIHVLTLSDPSDYEQLFTAVRPVLAALPGPRESPESRGRIPVAEEERPTKSGASRGYPGSAEGFPRASGERQRPVDVLLSAGTPQAQATWLLLVKAELLRARMLKVVPAAFVPDPHPHPVVEVRVDFAGFPEIRALREEVGRLRARVAPHGLVGESPPIVALRARLEAVARSDVPVVIHGETGTGKELVAEAIHKASPRAKGPWVAENCGAFAEGVLQSELFGHERGAFTGAAGRRRGLFEVADTGTLFLDEIGEMPLSTQATLLRVLQDGTLRRVGAERPIRVDVRLVVATHRDLAARVRDGTFREDLYYRLRGATLEVPPLRARVGDLELLVSHFLASRQLSPTPAVWRALRAWHWPGNVRELRAEVLRWGVFCEDRVTLADLSAELRGEDTREEPSEARAVRPLANVVTEAEHAAIMHAMSVTEGNLSQAARALGIDRNTLKRKLGR